MLSVGESLLAAYEAPFQPIRPEFADFDGDISISFNWPGIFDYYGIPAGESSEIFGFHGHRLDGVDDDDINEEDRGVVGAIGEDGGLTAYRSFKHLLLPKISVNLCMWKNPDFMKQGTRTDEHIRAVKRAPEFYKKYRLVWYRAARLATASQVDFTKLGEVHWPKPMAT